MAAVAKARVVVLEVNPNVPFAHGQCHVHISQVTAWSKAGPDPRSRPARDRPGAGSDRQAVADMIEDGSTLQIGYGGIPDAVVMQLTHKRDLGVHTEMIGDGILTLVECGAVTNRKKTLLPGKMVATFALGSRKLYEFMHHNPMLEMHPVELHQRPVHRRPERQAGDDQRQPAGRPAGPVRQRKHRPPALFRHRRPGRLRARGQPFARRQILHRAALHGQGRQHLAHRADAHARHPRHHQQERRQLCRHRIRRGPAARQVGQAAGAGADRDRAPGFPAWLREEANRMCVF
jgi:hypothetical protein